MKIVKHSNYYFSFSGILFLGSILIWIALGLRLGIDFTGGSLLEVDFPDGRPTADVIQTALASFDVGSVSVQPVGDTGYNLRFKEIDEELHQSILAALQPQEDVDGEEDAMKHDADDIQITQEGSGDIVAEVSTESGESPVVIEKRFTSIGPVIGQELKRASVWLSIAVIIAIVLYIAWSFRKVSYPVSSWKYGVIAVVALIHDVVITIGIFILLGQWLQYEINAPFVAAILTILGYSVNDTIIAFDRIRENLHKYEGDFEEIVDVSINETASRSINTSFTTLLTLIAIFVFGGESIKDFVLALIIGITFGTYSSIFIASPLLVVWQKLAWRLKKSHT